MFSLDEDCLPPICCNDGNTGDGQSSSDEERHAIINLKGK
jgi:hypothetical protein